MSIEIGAKTSAVYSSLRGGNVPAVGDVSEGVEGSEYRFIQYLSGSSGLAGLAGDPVYYVTPGGFEGGQVTHATSTSSEILAGTLVSNIQSGQYGWVLTEGTPLLSQYQSSPIVKTLPTVPALLADTSLGYSIGGSVTRVVSEGDLVEAGGYRFTVKGSGATDHDVENSAATPVKLSLADDATSASALGATDAADPDGREAKAPALVQSMQARKQYGVTLRDLLGRNYNPLNDASVALNGFLAELAPAGIAITDPDNLEVLFEAPIRVVDDFKLLLGPNTTFKRGYADLSTDTGALFSRADWSVNTNGFILSGGIITTASASQTGKLFNIYGDDWQILNTKFTQFRSPGQGVVFGGNNIRMVNVEATTTDTAGGTGAFRMTGGDGFRGIALRGAAGDDIFGFVPITNNANARFDQSISDSYYIGCTGVSHSARLLIAAIEGPQTDNDLTCTIRDVGWIGCGGKSGNRSVVVSNTDGDGTVARQVDNVLIHGCNIDASDENTLTDQSILINEENGNAIGRVTIRDTRLFGVAREHGLSIAAPNAEVIIDNCQMEGEGAVIDVTGVRRLTINAGEYQIVDNGGSASANWVIDMTTAAGAAELVVTGDPVIRGVASSKAAIRLSSSTALAYIGDLTCYKASGATGTIGVSHATGAAVRLGLVKGDLDSPDSGGGYVERNGVSAVSSANLASATHACNTKFKHTNKLIFDFNADKLYRATGGAAISAWEAVDGSGSVTPS